LPLARRRDIAPMTGDIAAHDRSAGILVGFDHSPAGAAALRWAARQGDMQGCHLHVIHTWEPEPGEVASLTAEQHARMREAVVAGCTKGIKDVLAGRSPDAGVEIEILEGPAGPILVEHARDASMLVLGLHERPGHRRLSAGSVSYYCLSHAPCAVVGVPAEPPGASDDTAP
jgi:nucleotide-binding universal stress UspA family protein